jgi:predicted  nucleic acid-binding Zn-ribbon protein
MRTIVKKSSAMPLGDVDKELRKIEAHIQDVSNRLENSELELGESVRLSVQRRELEAYLRGILFAIGEAPPQENAFEPET